MELRYFIIRRLLLIIPTALGLTLFVFILMSAIPISSLTSPYYNPHSPLSHAEQIKKAMILLGISPNPIVWYFHYVTNLLRGNWGIMALQGYPSSVIDAIGLALPNTIQLDIFAVLLSVIISIPVGTYIGSKPNSFADQFGRVFTLTGYAIPSFWLALLLQIVFGQGVILGNPVGVFPLTGSFNPFGIPVPTPSWFMGQYTTPTHLFIFDALLHGDLSLAWDGFMHIVLPVLTLTYGLLAGILRFVRAGMVDNSRMDFVKTARAKGVPEKLVIKKHVRKNALIPTITVMGLLIAFLLNGSVVVEYVFLYPGMGFLEVNALLTQQVYGIISTTLIFGVVLMITNLIVDIIYAMIDPRIRY